MGLGAAAAVVLAAIFAAPWFPLLSWSFSAVCHQIPSRSFEWLGRPLPVCARCLGFYAGMLGGALVPVKIPARWLGLLAAVNALDALFSLTGNLPRFLLALVFCWPAVEGFSSVLARGDRPAGH